MGSLTPDVGRWLGGSLAPPWFVWFMDATSNLAMDGDRAFLGVESRLEAGALGPGLVSMARNTRMRKGKLETRRGIAKMNWAGRRGAYFPLRFPVDFDLPMRFVEVFGAGRWDDPNGFEWVIVAASVIAAEGGKVYAARGSNGMREVPLAAGETITGEVSFTQCFNVLIMFRGTDAAPLVMTSLTEGFKAIEPVDSEANAGDGTEEIPNAASGLFLQNRLFIPYGRDLVAVSDALNYTRYAPPTSTFRINQGSSDELVGLYAFNDSTIVCAKESSINVVSNLVADASGRFTGAVNDSVTTSWGFIARKSVVQAGADLIGLSQMGVMSIRQTEQNKLQGIDVPLSAPMQAVTDRINWTYASGACGAYWDSKYYLAAPLDDGELLGSELLWSGAAYVGGVLRIYGLEPGRRYRLVMGAHDDEVTVGEGVSYSAAVVTTVDFVATQEWVQFAAVNGQATGTVTASVRELYTGVNNAVMVYDFVRQQWDGYDDGAAVGVKQFFKLRYQGKERLFFVGVDGFVSLYEEGFEDEVWVWQGWPTDPADDFAITQGVVSQGIETEWTLRGYGLRALQNNGYQKASMEESRLAAVELSLRSWDPDFTVYVRPEGVGEEYAALGGETRSRTRYVTPFDAADWDATNVNDDHGTAGREDYSVALGAADSIYLGSGVDFEAHQASLERVKLHGRAQAAQVRVLNTSGRLELLRLELVTGAGRKRFGAKL